MAASSLNDFIASYRLVEYPRDDPAADSPLLIGARRSKEGYSALVKTQDAAQLPLTGREATLDEIMFHLEKGEEQ